MSLADSGRDPELLLSQTGFLRRVARSLLHDENDIDDAVQQAWLKALSRPPRASSGSSPARAWLARVLRSGIRESRRSDERRTSRERRVAAPEIVSDADPARAVERLHLLRALTDAVLDLAEPYRATVIARYLDELPPSAIAARDRLSVDTVETRLRRARAELRRRLDTQDGDDRAARVLAIADFARSGGVPTATASLGGAGLVGGAAVMAASTKAVLGVSGVALTALLGWWGWTRVALSDASVRRTPADVVAQGDETNVAGRVTTSSYPEPTALASMPSRLETRALATEPVPGAIRAVVVERGSRLPLPGARVLFRAESDDPLTRARAMQERQRRWRWRHLRDPEHYRTERQELERELQAVGTTFTADADGIVELPPFEAAWLAARAGERWFVGLVRRSNESPIRLELDLEVGLRIRVVDSRGEPVAGVPVAVEVQIDPRQRAVHWRGRTHGEAGIAEVPGIVFGASQAFGPRDTYARLGLVGASAPRVKVDARSQSADPVELGLLPMGRLRIELRDDLGRPFLDEAYVGIGEKQESAHFVIGQTDLRWQQARDGVVEMDHVGLGLDLVAILHIGNEERRPRLLEFRGPTHEDETVTLIMTPAERVPVLTGRLLGPDGEPVRDWTLRARYQITQDTRETQAATDEEGRFRFPLTRYHWQYTDEWSEGAKNELMLDLDAPEALGAEFAAAAAVIHLTPEQLEPGEHDLGEIGLMDDTCIARGVVVDEQSRPLSGLQVVIERRRDPRDGWYADYNYLVSTGRDGSFTIRGRLEDASVRATVRNPGVYVEAPVEFEPENRDVRIVVTPAAEIRGRVLVDAGMRADLLTIAISESLVIRGTYTIDPRERVKIGADGSFCIDTVRPGTGSVRVGIGSVLAPDFEELARVDDVVMSSGAATHDERLDGIDLRGMLRLLEIRVVDASDVPLPGAVVRLLREPSADGDLGRVQSTDSKGVATFLAAATTYQVQVEGHGFEARTIPGVTVSRTVDLEPLDRR